LGYIYLFKSISEHENLYKIGYTKNKNTLKKRVKQLQTGNPNKIKMVNYFESYHGRKIETTLHNIYSTRRLEGEWFDLDEYDVDNFIESCKKIEDNFDILSEYKNPYI
jgi:hypothetical protein